MPRHNNSRKLLATINLDIYDDLGEADTTTPETLNKVFVFIQQASTTEIPRCRPCIGGLHDDREGSFSLLPNSS